MGTATVGRRGSAAPKSVAAKRAPVAKGNRGKLAPAARHIRSGPAPLRAIDRGGKMDLLAYMSHEVRTPIYSILGMAQLALDADDNRQAREFLNLIKLSADGLLALVNDILDFSKMEAGCVRVEHVPFSLRACLREAVATLTPGARAKSLTVTWTVDPETPDNLLGDPLRLRQVLLNLLGNAIKFTASGEIALAARIRPDAAGTPVCHVSVRDTGIGIPADRLATLFRPFCQADAAIARNHGGTGLGLAICAGLVALMGGDIGVESSAGVGSTFHFSFPVSIDEVPAGDALPEVAAEVGGGAAGRAIPVPPAILVVDDDPVNRRVTQALLTRAGYQVSTAGDGACALTLLDHVRFGMIVMDVQMEGMSGVETAATIRRREAGSGERVPIIGLSAHAQTEHRARCLAAGMDDYLVKPIHAAALQAALDRARRRGTLPAARGAGQACVDVQTLRARVADNDMLLDELAGLFRHQGRQLLPQARAALAARDGARLARTAHALAGLLGNLAAGEAAQLAARLESTVGHAGWPELEAGFARLERQIRCVEEELTALARPFGRPASGALSSPADRAADAGPAGAPPTPGPWACA